MEHKVCILALGLTILVGGASFGAAQGGPNMGFEQHDTDGNGEISRAEAEAHRAARFAAADINGDGAVSLEELSARASARAEVRAAKMMMRLDSDKNGALSAEELGQRGGRDMFARADADGSGTVSRAEFDAARAARADKRSNQAKN